LNDCENVTKMLIPGRLTKDNQVTKLFGRVHKSIENTAKKVRDTKTGKEHEKPKDSPVVRVQLDRRDVQQAEHSHCKILKRKLHM